MNVKRKILAMLIGAALLVPVSVMGQSNTVETGWPRMVVFNRLGDAADSTYISAGIGGTGGEEDDKAYFPTTGPADSLALAGWEKIHFMLVENMGNGQMEFSLNLDGGWSSGIQSGYASSGQYSVMALPVSITLDRVRNPRRANGHHDVVMYVDSSGGDLFRVYLFGE